MTEPAFDPTNAVQFDLNRGRVDIHRAPTAVIPIGALEALCESAGEEGAKDFGRLVGTDIGARILGRLRNVAEADASVIVDHLGGELALLGAGSLGLERWGAALVFTVTNCPFTRSSEGWIAGVFEGALQRAAGKVVHAVSLPRQGDVVRVLLTGQAGAQKAAQLLAGGGSLGQVMEQLNALGAQV